MVGGGGWDGGVTYPEKMTSLFFKVKREEEKEENSEPAGIVEAVQAARSTAGIGDRGIGLPSIAAAGNGKSSQCWPGAAAASQLDIWQIYLI